MIPVSNAIDGVVPGPNGLLPMPVRPIWGAAPINAQQERDYNFEVKEYQASYTMRSDENKITMTYRTRWTETTKQGLELVKSRVSVDIWKRLTEAQKASVAAIWTTIEEMITGGTRNSGVIRALHESQRYYFKLGGLREYYNKLVDLEADLALIGVHEAMSDAEKRRIFLRGIKTWEKDQNQTFHNEVFHYSTLIRMEGNDALTRLNILEELERTEAAAWRDKLDMQMTESKKQPGNIRQVD